jgi:decaheme cytochrome c component MtrC/MtrF-like protein
MRRIVQATITILVPGIFFVAGICLVGVGVSAQKQRRRTPVKRQAITRPATIDYSRFSHATKKHQGTCNTCHKVPTKNWPKARDYPDVADYPDHDACVSCHRAQFFKGAKPVICSICHTKVSPRDDARLAFRNPAAPRQFLIEFPHDKHQDVIARLFRRWQTEAPPRFVHASFNSSQRSPTPSLTVGLLPRSLSVKVQPLTQAILTLSADEKTKHFNNCEICHGPRTNAPAAPATGWPDSFAPDAATFKASPRSHASCFNCHWKSQPPTSEDCAGCHKLADKAYVAFDSPTRFSLKFRHAREQHVAECTTCHINITKAATLRGLKPDVPITSCTECHNKDGLRLDVSNELEAIDKNRDFVCSYCHTSDVGRRDPPASHYLISGREPIKRRDVK